MSARDWVAVAIAVVVAVATGGLAGVNSSSFTVGAAAADHLAFSVQPGTSTAGATSLLLHTLYLPLALAHSGKSDVTLEGGAFGRAAESKGRQ